MMSFEKRLNVRPSPRRDAGILSMVMLGGGVVAVTLFAASCERAPRAERVVEQAIVIAPEPEPARVAPDASTTTTELMSIADVPVKAARPIIPLAHEEKETDFLAKGADAVLAGELDAALVFLRKHLFDHAPTADVLLEVGRIARQTGELALAEQALMDAGALAPTNAEVQHELARVLLDAGRPDEARTHARQALRLDPENASGWNLAGRIAMAQSAWARAESALRRAVELDPMNPMIHNNLGLLYIYTHKGEDAVDSLETAVELYEHDAPHFVLNNLGLAHELAGNLEGAEEAFEQALVVNPTYSRARVNLERVAASLAELEAKGGFDTAAGPEAEPTAEEAKPAL